jgi:hypothetical protein
MRVRPVRLLAAAALAAGALTAVAGPAPAVTATFTRITSVSGSKLTTLPSHDLLFKYDGNPGATNQMTVSGTTSPDVTNVDVICITYAYADGSLEVSDLSPSPVPVSSGQFSTIAVFDNPSVNCRLRAIPSTVDPHTDYLGSYAGPILYTNGLVLAKAGGVPYTYEAIGEQGNGIMAVLDVGACGPSIGLTVDTPAMELHGPAGTRCAFALSRGNIKKGSSNPTASAIKVGGQNAYVPSTVHSYLNEPSGLNLGLPQPKLTTTFQRSSNGDVTVTESEPLMRCNTNTYPVTPNPGSSCTGLVSTGVKFTRVVNIFRGAHQARLRDTFTSTDGLSHTLSLQYEGSITAPSAGATGYVYPNHTSTFHEAGFDQEVTGLGTKAGTILVRSDMYAASNDPSEDTLGLTWSRAPQEVLFHHDQVGYFALPYSFTVPAGGHVYLGFAYSERQFTTDTKKLAALAVGEMLNAPVISSPVGGATIKGHATTFKGYVTLGANGLPTSVTVAGHPAKLTKVSATKETYAVTFNEAFGTHKIKVVAKDSAGNTRSKAITVTNVS